MKDKVCFACRCEGKITLGDNLDVIYQDNGESYIHQCYTHSVELFKVGQFNFITKYKPSSIGYELPVKSTAPTSPSLFAFGNFR